MNGSIWCLQVVPKQVKGTITETLNIKTSGSQKGKEFNTEPSVSQSKLILNPSKPYFGGLYNLDHNIRLKNNPHFG